MEAQTRQVRLSTSSPTQALANMATVLEAAGCDYRHVVKTTVLLQDIRHLPLVDAVYGEVFRVAPPARTVYQVSGGRGGARWRPCPGTPRCRWRPSPSHRVELRF